MIGSATSPPNPRGLIKERFATPEQKLIAQYNIACCYAQLGDTPRAMEILSEYVKQVASRSRSGGVSENDACGGAHRVDAATVLTVWD